MGRTGKRLRRFLQRLSQQALVLLRLVKLGVVQRHGGLIGEDLQIVRVSRGERPHLFADQAQDADDLVLVAERGRYVSAHPAHLRDVNPAGIGARVGDDERLPGFGHVAQVGRGGDVEPQGKGHLFQAAFGIAPAGDRAGDPIFDQHNHRRVVRRDMVEIGENLFQQFAEVERAGQGGGGIAHGFGQGTLLAFGSFGAHALGHVVCHADDPHRLSVLVAQREVAHFKGVIRDHDAPGAVFAVERTAEAVPKLRAVLVKLEHRAPDQRIRVEHAQSPAL